MFGKKKSKKEERIDALKEETKRRIRFHEKDLAEEMNLRLICSMGEENTLWVDSVTVTEIIFPEYKKYKKRKRKKGFLWRLQNSFRDYRWTT